jgi:Rho-binding antiterminator
MGEYLPISCIAHERLEFAVLRRQKLRLHLRDASGMEQVQVVLPTDVTTRDRAEWLSYRDEAGNMGVIRLDRILAAEPA